MDVKQISVPAKPGIAWGACLALMVGYLTVAQAQPVPDAHQQVYRQLAAALERRDAVAIASRFDEVVLLDLGEGTQRGNYRKPQAATVLGSYFRAVAPEQQSVQIVKMTQEYMLVRFFYRDAAGRRQQGMLFFTVRGGESGLMLTGIRR